MADSSKLIEQLQKRLQILEDKDALAALLNRYCNIADAKDWEGYADTYTDDPVMTFESWGDIVGKAAIQKAASAEQIFEGLQHSMTNMQFEVDGSDTATGTAYLWFAATPETAKPEINYSFGGPYKFEFKRTDAGWRISRMRLKKIWAHGKDTKGVFGGPETVQDNGLFYIVPSQCNVGPSPAKLLPFEDMLGPGSGTMEGKVGIVTGAGTPYGIGRSIVLQLAQAGAKAVYACDLNLANIPSLKEACKTMGSNTIIEGKVLDVSDDAQTVQVLKEITKEHGRFDFYFANAGIANYRNLNDTEMSHYDRQINIMQRGAFLAIKYGSQAMMVTSEQKTTPGGSFVITGSCASYLGSYSDLPYAVAKTALHGLISAASVQLSSSNIRVNGVAPGFTVSSLLTVSKDAEKGGEYSNKMDDATAKKNHHWFFERAGLLAAPQYYYNRVQDPDEVARVQMFLASDLATAVNGQMILVDSGKTAAAVGEACTGPIPPVKPLDIS